MFKKLFCPAKINNCLIANRLVVPAMVTNYCDGDGLAGARYIAYHEEKAKGGWGLIITEDYAVNPRARGYRNLPGLWDDKQIAGHKKLTDAVHKYDSKIFAQIYHAGRQSRRSDNGGAQPVAPSAVPCPVMKEMPRELSVGEIKELVDDFGNCARRVKQAGFDGLEIHAAHGYLIAQFLSAYANKRTDAYGGNLDNRIRFLREIYQAVRENVGGDFPVIVRFSAVEGLPGGRTMAESLVLSGMLEDMGFDALHVSCSAYGDYNRNIASSMYVEHAWIADYAAQIKKVVDIPVITVNRINDPRMADNIINMGKTDFIAMGRGSLADPGLPEKARAGDFGSIRYCVTCMQGCTGVLHTNQAITCMVNPALGREYELDYGKAARPKMVYVAGGGLCGLQAARTAALRGHEVTLFEKKGYLGGQFKSAAYPPGKGEMAAYVAWLTAELEKLSVKVLLDTPLTGSVVKLDRPDAIVAATGGKPLRLPLGGMDKPHVFFAEDVLLGKAQTGNRVLIAGGGEVGAETAAYLAAQQKDVVIAEMLPRILFSVPEGRRYHLQKILLEGNVRQETNARVCEITDDAVILERSGERFAVAIDTVVLALGYAPDRALYEELAALYDNVILAGGALNAGDALQAARAGFDAGMSI